MAAVNGDFGFVVAVVNGDWTRITPSPADTTIPATAGDRLNLTNNGSGTIYVIKRAHVSGSPSPALPAATVAGALADAGLKAQIMPSQQIPIRASKGALPDFIRCNDYYAWTDNASGDPLSVDPIN